MHEPEKKKEPESKLVKRFGDDYELKQFDWQVREVLEEIEYKPEDEDESEPGFLFVKKVRGEDTIEEVWKPWGNESIPWLWVECIRIK